MKLNKIVMLMAATLLVVFTLVGCSSGSTNTVKETGKTEKQVEKNVTIGTHPVGTGYNPVSSGIAKLISDHTQIKASTSTMAGPNAFIPLLNKSNLELGVAAAPDVAWGFAGTNGYEANKNVRVLVIGGNTTMAGFVVRKDSAIKKVSDLKGKRVASNYGGNILAAQILTGELKVAGLTWNDVTKVPVADVTTGIDAIADGRADAAFGLGVTSSKVVEVNATVGLRPVNGGGVSPSQISAAPKEVLDIMHQSVRGIDFQLDKAGTG